MTAIQLKKIKAKLLMNSIKHHDVAGSLGVKRHIVTNFLNGRTRGKSDCDSKKVADYFAKWL